MPQIFSLQGVRSRIGVIGILVVTLGLGMFGETTIGIAADDASPSHTSTTQTLTKEAPAEQLSPTSSIPKNLTQTISVESLKNIDPKVIANLQKDLDFLGYENDGEDGVIIRKALTGLKKFATDFHLPSTDFVIQVIVRVYFIASRLREFPNWGTVIDSQEFVQWLQKQLPDSQKIITDVRKSGKPQNLSQQLTAILKDFTQTHPAKRPKPDPVPDLAPDPDSASAPDLDSTPVPAPDAGAEEIAQQAEEKIIAQLTLLENTNKEHEQEFLKEVNQVLNAVPEPYSQFAQTMREQAQQLEAFVEKDAVCEQIADDAIPVDMLSLLSMLPNKEVVCLYKTMTIDALRHEQNNQNMAPQRAELLQQATLLQQFDQHKSQPLEWEGESCGCSSNLSRTVYGFYPFWMSDGKPQHIDFSVLSRIGYAALTFDETGKLKEDLHWSQTKPDANFLKTAHQYRTAMDVVIYNRDWRGWEGYTNEETEIILDKLSTNIVEKVTAPFTGYIINALKPYLSLGLTPTPTIGDGVTLYLDFEAFQGKQSEEVFSTLYSFLSKLRQKLDQVNTDYFLNVTFSAHHLLGQTGAYSLQNLKRLKDDVDLFLVVMDRRGSVTLPQVRQQIIDLHLNSTVERQLIRKMVPVVFRSDQEKPEVQELVSYAEDNFGGLGVWPVPLVPEQGEDVMNQVLKEEFLLSRDGAICQFVCPQRWVFRMIMNVLVGLIVIYGLLAAWVYDFRKWIETYPVGFLVVMVCAIIILVLTFWCDPFWKQRQTEMVLGVLMIMTVGSLWVGAKKRREATYP